MRLRLLPRLLVFAAWLARLPGTAAQEPSATGVLASEVSHLGWIIYGARSTAGDWDLFACRPDASARRPLTRTPDFNEFAPQVSRDGRRLLYRRLPRVETIDGNRYGAQGELVLANADGTGARVLGPAGEWPWASFSPDATQVATLSVKGFAFVNLERLEVLRTLPRQGFFQQPAWSPDGRWLVGVANSYGTGWSVARLDLRTGEASAVSRGDCCTPDWFPDSRRVIFSWRPPGQTGNGGQGWTQLWQATIEGDSRQLVFGEDGRHVYGGHVSPDGRYVLFTGNVEEDGDPGRAGAPMGLLRLSDAPILGGESRELRRLHPHANRGPVLTLPAGWEPCWTPDDIFDPRAPPTARPPLPVRRPPQRWRPNCAVVARWSAAPRRRPATGICSCCGPTARGVTRSPAPPSTTRPERGSPRWHPTALLPSATFRTRRQQHLRHVRPGRRPGRRQRPGGLGPGISVGLLGAGRAPARVSDTPGHSPLRAHQSRRRTRNTPERHRRPARLVARRPPLRRHRERPRALLEHRLPRPRHRRHPGGERNGAV
ncbi:MAG: hypothetical protein M5U12_05415 [Verrucomicrobia bacterium]|nr:hypothetical protein [Verrucomicrobiota bacterium]